MDKTGLQFQHKSPKMVAEKGVKNLYHRASDSKETVTVVACVSVGNLFDKINKFYNNKGISRVDPGMRCVSKNCQDLI